MERDEKGRFKKATRTGTEDTDEMNALRNGEFIVRIPFAQYIPFIVICALFLAIAYPWFIVMKPLTRALLLYVGDTMVKRIKKSNSTDDGW